MTDRPLISLGTRGSPLAIAQTEAVRLALAAAVPELAAPGAVAIVPIRTTGDRILDRPLAEFGGKGMFTREIDEALLSGAVDAAVHSMKDVPTVLPEGIVLPAMLPREDPRDAILCLSRPRPAGLADLPPGAVVGTASLRRSAFVKARRPDLRVVTFRGNVHTRLAKLSEGLADVTLLAAAGLSRLGMLDRAAAILPVSEMLPAVAQGAIGITCRKGDDRLLDWLARIADEKTMIEVACERAFLAVLDGSCRTPIGGLARLAGGRLDFSGALARTDGSAVFSADRSGPAADADAAARIGADAGAEVRAEAGPAAP